MPKWLNLESLILHNHFENILPTCIKKWELITSKGHEKNTISQKTNSNTILKDNALTTKLFLQSHFRHKTKCLLWWCPLATTTTAYMFRVPSTTYFTLFDYRLHLNGRRVLNSDRNQYYNNPCLALFLFSDCTSRIHVKGPYF